MLGFRAAVIDFCGLRTDPAVARAQVEALRHRLPFLYAIIGINTAALSATHFASNPVWQVVLLPGALILSMIVRIVFWVRVDPTLLSDAEIHQLRHQVVFIGSIMGFFNLLWAATLDHSAPFSIEPGGMNAAGQAGFFVAITVISSLFLLMHHRLASIAVVVTVVLPFVFTLFLSHRLIETAVGLNVFLVAAAMLSVAISFSRHFDQSVLDAAEMQSMSQSNARLAVADVLTSLPNRRQFFLELTAAGAGSTPFAVVVCDLDGFKQINDVYGHQAGDEVLRQIAIRLQLAVPEGSCVARMGGDEFTCLLVGERSRVATDVAERMIACCSQPMTVNAFTAQLGASAGVCFSAQEARSEPELIYTHADYALFEAKRSGRGRAETFNATHERSMRRESTIAHLLRTADFERELMPVFQPIVSAETFQIRAFEALARWTSPELGVVGPQEFIPIAERTDLIFGISRFMLRASLKWAAAWPDGILLKVNLSVRDLMSSEQTLSLLAELSRSGVAPSRVTFEITETILAESLEQIRLNVDIVRAAGCKIAVDDFGVGYSSLNYIHMLAPDMIKIDRCFVEKITSNNTTRRVVRTIVELARNVGAVSVAEGVETAAQAQLLAELGCNELQGYFISRPVGAESSVEMTRTKQNFVRVRTADIVAVA